MVEAESWNEEPKIVAEWPAAKGERLESSALPLPPLLLRFPLPPPLLPRFPLPPLPLLYPQTLSQEEGQQILAEVHHLLHSKIP